MNLEIRPWGLCAAATSGSNAAAFRNALHSNYALPEFGGGGAHGTHINNSSTPSYVDQDGVSASEIRLGDHQMQILSPAGASSLGQRTEALLCGKRSNVCGIFEIAQTAFSTSTFGHSVPARARITGLCPLQSQDGIDPNLLRDAPRRYSHGAA